MRAPKIKSLRHDVIPWKNVVDAAFSFEIAAETPFPSKHQFVRQCGGEHVLQQYRRTHARCEPRSRKFKL